jgi:hypothetical protein
LQSFALERVRAEQSFFFHNNLLISDSLIIVDTKILIYSMTNYCKIILKESRCISSFRHCLFSVHCFYDLRNCQVILLSFAGVSFDGITFDTSNSVDCVGIFGRYSLGPCHRLSSIWF